MGKYLCAILCAMLVLAFVGVIGKTCDSDGLDMTLHIQSQTKDTLVLSAKFTNKTCDRVVLYGFSALDLACADFFSKNKYIQEVGSVKDTIRLLLPFTGEEYRNQVMNNGDTLDVFGFLSPLIYPLIVDYVETPVAPEPPDVDLKSLCRDSFYDEDLFNCVWNDSMSYPHETFYDNEEPSCWGGLVTIEPFESKEISIDMSYLLKRKATYILQLDGSVTIKKDGAIKSFSEKYGCKAYTGKLYSEPINVVSK